MKSKTICRKCHRLRSTNNARYCASCASTLYAKRPVHAEGAEGSTSRNTNGGVVPSEAPAPEAPAQAPDLMEKLLHDAAVRHLGYLEREAAKSVGAYPFADEELQFMTAARELVTKGKPLEEEEREEIARLWSLVRRWEPPAPKGAVEPEPAPEPEPEDQPEPEPELETAPLSPEPQPETDPG